MQELIGEHIRRSHYFDSHTPDQNNRIFVSDMTACWVTCRDVRGRTRSQCFAASFCSSSVSVPFGLATESFSDQISFSSN